LSPEEIAEGSTSFFGGFLQQRHLPVVAVMMLPTVMVTYHWQIYRL
jgi:hypothetical protein